MSLPIALAAAPSLLAQRAVAADAPDSAVGDVLQRRQLGKNGPQVTMLCMGGMMAALSPDYLDIAWSMGIRYFDTADCYIHGQSEKIFAQWLAKYPERRKEIFLVSKDHPHQGPGAVAGDDRQAAGRLRHDLSRRLLHPRHRPARIRRRFLELAEERRLQKNRRGS